MNIDFMYKKCRVPTYLYLFQNQIIYIGSILYTTPEFYYHLHCVYVRYSLQIQSWPKILGIHKNQIMVTF